MNTLTITEDKLSLAAELLRGGELYYTITLEMGCAVAGGGRISVFFQNYV